MDGFVFSLLLHISMFAYQILSKHPSDFICMQKWMSLLYIEHKRKFTLEFQTSLKICGFPIYLPIVLTFKRRFLRIKEESDGTSAHQFTVTFLHSVFI